MFTVQKPWSVHTSGYEENRYRVIIAEEYLILKKENCYHNQIEKKNGKEMFLVVKLLYEYVCTSHSHSAGHGCN